MTFSLLTAHLFLYLFPLLPQIWIRPKDVEYCLIFKNDIPVLGHLVSTLVNHLSNPGHSINQQAWKHFSCLHSLIQQLLSAHYVPGAAPGAGHTPVFYSARAAGTKYSILRDFNDKHGLRIVLEAKSPRSACQHRCARVRTQQQAALSLYPHMVERGWKSSWVAFVRP